MSTFLIDDDDLPRVPVLLRLFPCALLRATVYPHDGDAGAFSVYVADPSGDAHVFLFVLSRTSDHSAEHFSLQSYDAAEVTQKTVERSVRVWFDRCLSHLRCPEEIDVVFYSEKIAQQKTSSAPADTCPHTNASPNEEHPHIAHCPDCRASLMTADLPAKQRRKRKQREGLGG